jgi:hypothetical protein
MVNNDFVARTLEPSHVAELIKLRTLGEITQETLLIQLADGEWLYDGFDVDEELEKTMQAKAEGLQAQQDQLDASVQELPGQPEAPAATTDDEALQERRQEEAR